MSVVSVSIRPLQVRDADTLAALYIANQEFLEPFDPPRPAGFATSASQRRDLKALERERAADRLERFLIEAGGGPAGVISVSRITRGPFQNAGLGYWVTEGMNGRGIATRAVGLVCEWGFGQAGFHRLEAATLVDNTASQTVLRRNNFTEIGLSPRYLFIAGAWRDHILFARTAED
jgi:ribosomal-protein-alanine N-acetyltransferase